MKSRNLLSYVHAVDALFRAGVDRALAVDLINEFSFIHRGRRVVRRYIIGHLLFNVIPSREAKNGC